MFNIDQSQVVVAFTGGKINSKRHVFLKTEAISKCKPRNIPALYDQMQLCSGSKEPANIRDASGLF